MSLSTRIYTAVKHASQITPEAHTQFTHRPKHPIDRLRELTAGRLKIISMSHNTESGAWRKSNWGVGGISVFPKLSGDECVITYLDGTVVKFNYQKNIVIERYKKINGEWFALSRRHSRDVEACKRNVPCLKNSAVVDRVLDICSDIDPRIVKYVIRELNDLLREMLHDQNRAMSIQSATSQINDAFELAAMGIDWNISMGNYLHGSPPTSAKLAS